MGTGRNPDAPAGRTWTWDIPVTLLVKSDDAEVAARHAADAMSLAALGIRFVKGEGTVVDPAPAVRVGDGLWKVTGSVRIERTRKNGVVVDSELRCTKVSAEHVEVIGWGNPDLVGVA